jgi:hypothetical protein
MRLDGAIDRRLEQWAAYRAGSGSVSVAPFAHLRYGTTPEADPSPRDEELETDRLIALLPANERTFIGLMYPRQSVRTAMVANALGLSMSAIEKMLRRVQSDLARMLDQRRRGETIDPAVRRIRDKAQRIKVNGKRVALVAPEEIQPAPIHGARSITRKETT